MTQTLPGLYGVAPGADYPVALVAGLRARYGHLPPERFARITVWVNTRRMERRIAALLADSDACLLPRLRLIADLGRDSATGLPPPVPPLRRTLDLTRLVRALIAAEPDLAPDSAAFDLAASLAALIDEMQGEGVPLAAIAALDVTDLSGHWARSQRFLALAGRYLDATRPEALDPEARQRRMVADLIARWDAAPPTDPVIVAGSTGSRGTTALLMAAVARLSGGSVVLPGHDPGMPPAIWQALMAPDRHEDHPQFRFAALCDTLGVAPWDIRGWADTAAPAPARNAVVSLALRPAPVTDGWRRDGPALGDLRAAMDGVALIEAPDPRAESLAIALRLRRSVEDGETAALITPDRMLTRRVAAALDRWGILPDDSGGEPLRQSAVGRLVRHVAGLFGRPLTPEALLVVLKHPMVHRAGGRNQHLLWTRDLERALRRDGPAFPDPASLSRWAAARAQARPDAPDPRPWAEWVAACCAGHADVGEAPLGALTALLMSVLDQLGLGHDADHTALDLWSDLDGRAARRALDDLAAEAAAAPDGGGRYSPAAFSALLNSLMGAELRDPVQSDPRVMIWGTLEARVQGADLVILAGLNDGTWPDQPAPDPWLNRAMRAQAGLLMPERRIGLAAHDFQQAIGARRVVLSRALRDGEAATVPSRWLNRLTNLLTGLPAQGGDAALADMRAAGTGWLTLAAQLDRPDTTAPPAARPAPQPPVDARPGELSVTRIETLIRDPYEIYAGKILRLDPLDRLRRAPEARDRGDVLHKVMEAAVQEMARHPGDDWAALLMEAADRVLARDVPWPTARRLWRARLARVSERFVRAERARQAEASPLVFERKGWLDLHDLGFRVTAKADRIDRDDRGRLHLYDYKTGEVPSTGQLRHFARQLLLSTAIAEAGGFEGVEKAPVAQAVYLSLGAALKTQPAPIGDEPPASVLAGLRKLIGSFQRRETGYGAQLARASDRQTGDFDHLARAGEWDIGSPACAERVGD